MKKWIPVVLLSISSFQSAFAASDAKTVTDSFVKKLSCQNLSVDSIYESLQPTAYHTYYHLPIQNWGFNSAGADLGVCWGLSSAQRRMFMLGRFEEKEELSRTEIRNKTLDILRGFDYSPLQSFDYSPLQTSRGREMMVATPIRRWDVVKFSDTSMIRSWAREDMDPEGIYPLVNRGYAETAAGKPVWKTYKLDVERGQQQRFFRGGNLAMVVGDTLARGTVDNLVTMTTLAKNLAGKRLTLLNLRWGMMDQHVVVAKNMMENERYYIIFVYDSNRPLADGMIYFDKKQKTFHAPGIRALLPKHVAGDEKKEAGVFLVDEDDRAPLEEAMLRHYRAECNK
ncbi:hypothetical protein B9G69_011390 [Bdellovibrio sp. SKB1291214]|uniref:hypothetical protein n=1 Tax=Bdellovibrio sp. SKB1291214 TaxID=1732569 RepID=UPI00223EB268|nr:hypothetical protein [Bdellovibrio sp. SKB1291214]UYL07650.1 hypothetical protein B9G69_011390 [Bdellovibrio sp. SKB1291214]